MAQVNKLVLTTTGGSVSYRVHVYNYISCTCTGQPIIILRAEVFEKSSKYSCLSIGLKLEFKLIC